MATTLLPDTAPLSDAAPLSETAPLSEAAPLRATLLPRLWQWCASRSLFGDAALLLFLLAQCFDGVFTYVGVVSYGIGIEANPLIASAMGTFGNGPGLVGAKLAAGGLGIGLHLRQVHIAVALLSVFYVAVAIIPWVTIFFL